MNKLIPFGLLLGLGACTTMNPMLRPVSPADVAALEEAVTIADTVALNYTRLPPCPAGTRLCSVPASRQAIKVYAQRAHDAVKTLQAASAADAPAALAAAQAALVALQTSIPATSIPATSIPATSIPAAPISH